MSRKITVLVESTQRKVVFESNAATLGELKNELRERQVQYDSDCVFKEAISKTILTSNESILPSNIPWKGQVTNDLMFMITTPHKKIKSGAMDRKEAYAKIKELGLQGKIQELEGKNFTQCSTALLIHYIENEKKVGKKAAKHNEMVSKGVLMQHDADNIWGVANGQPAPSVERELSYDELAEQFDF